jgi:hypothetical protein
LSEVLLHVVTFRLNHSIIMFQLFVFTASQLKRKHLFDYIMDFKWALESGRFERDNAES